MKVDVSAALDDLRRQFPEAALTVTEDGQGGAHVIMEPIDLGAQFNPQKTWFGFHIAPLYPYADIYPIFMGADVKRANGRPFEVPITPNHTHAGRPALQISRRNSAAQNGLQKACAKILKVLRFLEQLP